MLRKYLDALGTPYGVEPRLVRGLDYYTRTLFEITGAPEKLGAGSTLVGGGRYDSMVADLGGPQVPAFGFAAGVERLLIASEFEVPTHVIDALVAPLGSEAATAGLGLARDLRREGIRCEVDTRGKSLRSQLRRADALGFDAGFSDTALRQAGGCGGEAGYRVDQSAPAWAWPSGCSTHRTAFGSASTSAPWPR